MQGLANERGLEPLLQHAGAAPLEKAGSRKAGASRADGAPQRSGEVGRKLRAAREMLDGVGGLGWSVVGFVVGAVFWHFVGFWGFVSEVVLAGGPPAVAEHAIIHGAPPGMPAKLVQVAAAAGLPCTLVSRDRQTGITSARPCDRTHPELPADPYQGRQDRIATSGSGLPLATDGSPKP